MFASCWQELWWLEYCWSTPHRGMVHCRLQNKNKAHIYTYLSETNSNFQGLIKWWRNFWKCMCMYQFYNKSEIPSIKCFRPLAYRRLEGGNSISCLLVGFSFHCSQQRNHTLQKRYTCTVKKNIQHVACALNYIIMMVRNQFIYKAIPWVILFPYHENRGEIPLADPLVWHWPLPVESCYG